MQTWCVPAEPSEGGLQSAKLTAACKAGQDVAQDLLLQHCRLSATYWQPGSVLICSAWTLLAANLPPEEEALQQCIQQNDVESLKSALHGLHRCVGQAPRGPALWPDSLLWWYLLIAAKVSERGSPDMDTSLTGPHQQ